MTFGNVNFLNPHKSIKMAESIDPGAPKVRFLDQKSAAPLRVHGVFRLGSDQIRKHQSPQTPRRFKIRTGPLCAAGVLGFGAALHPNPAHHLPANYLQHLTFHALHLRRQPFCRYFFAGHLLKVVCCWFVCFFVVFL